MEMVGDSAGVFNIIDINQDDMNTAKQKYGVMWQIGKYETFSRR